VALVERLVEDAHAQGNHAAAALHEHRAKAYAEQADVLRRAVIATVNQRVAADT
jgi:hypothetical protein